MKVSFSFFNKLPTKDKSVIIINIINIDNSKQTGEPIRLAIKELEESVDKGIIKIAELIIIDTTFLNRFYDKRKIVKTESTQWYRANERYLTSSKFTITILPWYKILEFEKYPRWKALIKTAYEGDELGENLDKEWRERVNRLSGYYIHKSGLKGRIQYLLEESTGYVPLLEHFLKVKISVLLLIQDN